MSLVKVTCNIFIIAYITTWYGIQGIHQLMVDTVERPQIRCDKHNIKFQHHENLSLLSSAQENESYSPQSIKPKKGTNIILGSNV